MSSIRRHRCTRLRLRWRRSAPTAWRSRSSGGSRRRPSAASFMSGVWNAAATSSGMTLRMPASFAASVASARPSGVPAMTIWPGALMLATQHESGVPATAAAAWSSVAPRRAAMTPGLWSAASWVTAARLAATCRPLLEAERARGDERGHLAEGVAGERRRRRRSRPCAVSQHDERVQQNGHLGGLGRLQLVTEQQR